MPHEDLRERRLAERSRTIGFLARGGEMRPGAVAVRLPGELSGAERSVCGIKAFLVDERREFRAEDGSAQVVDCARVAALDITDSPVHVHGETVETYLVLSGAGRMVLDERVEPVGPGSCIVIPPGVEHGLSADDPAAPLRVMMTFAPGLAPLAHARWRDERIVHASAAARIAGLLQRNRE